MHPDIFLYWLEEQLDTATEAGGNTIEGVHVAEIDIAHAENTVRATMSNGVNVDFTIQVDRY